jgi:hypothetical protein
MSKQPHERFASASEVAGLFEECLAHVQQPDAVPLPHIRPSHIETSERNNVSLAIDQLGALAVYEPSSCLRAPPLRSP